MLHAYLGNSTSSVCTVREITQWMNASRTSPSSTCMLAGKKSLSLFSAREVLTKYFNNLEQQILGYRNGLSPNKKKKRKINSFSLFYWP